MTQGVDHRATDPRSRSVDICGCGAGAPARRNACGACGEAFPTPRLKAPDTGPRYWVAVRGGFTCRSCGFLAPLDHLPVDGAVECASCGLRQAFETAALSPALAHAQSAGDLAGPGSEGRTPHPRLYIGADNAFKTIGVDKAFDDFETSIDGRPTRLEAGPGHPVCGKCKVPLEVETQGGVVGARCPRCGEGARYTLPEGAQELCPGLVGVVAADHSDRPRARQAGGPGGVAALMCPSCGAPLHASSDRAVTCTFCRAVALIPARAAAQTVDKPPKASIWWLCFEGPSAKRRELETPIETAVIDNAAGAMLAQFQRLKNRGNPGETKAVETAPEAPGIGIAQLVVALVAAFLFLAITFPIANSVTAPDIPGGSHKSVPGGRSLRRR